MVLTSIASGKALEKLESKIMDGNKLPLLALILMGENILSCQSYSQINASASLSAGYFSIQFKLS